MAATVFAIEGMRDVRRALRRVGGNELLNGLKGAFGSAAATVERAALSLAPRRSGRMARTLRSSGTRTMAVVRAGRASVPYAGPVHWGWPGRPNPARGWRGGPIRGFPFIAIAAQRTEPVWRDNYERALRELVRRAEAGA
uniref:HK97 gp10 family phage protein n=1 Tax=Streptomyces sp. NBC_00003 TaxID=2903608 RepID=A0AAU2V7Q4_9ACTN